MNGREDKNILVVDDDLFFVQFMKDILEKGFDCRVVSATTIKEALERVEKDTPSLIFFDLNLPDGDGEQFCKRIGKTLGPKSVPKWIISGESSLLWEPQKWLGYEVKGFFSKPVKIDAIFEAVEKTFSNSD